MEIKTGLGAVPKTWGGRGAGGDRGFCCGSHSCSVTVRMARPLEQAVAAIVCTFREYAGRCGDKHKLCQAELKELLQKELPTWTPVSTWSNDPAGKHCLDKL